MTIDDLLRARYPAKTHALLFEVRDAAGFGMSRACDAIAISTWPSRGLKLMGFEIKASRADWLRELRDPDKAETFFTMTDEWYVVADGPKIVEPDEVPPTWGWLQRTGNRLVCLKSAPPRVLPAPIDRSLLAAMLKRCHDQAHAPVKAAFDRGFVAGKAAGEERRKEIHDHATGEIERLRKTIDDFERASGVRITAWPPDAPKIGEAVRLVLDGGHISKLRGVLYALPQARELVRVLEELAQTTRATDELSKTSHAHA